MAVADHGHDHLPLLGGAQVELAGRLCRLGVERLRLVVGVDGRLDQAPRLVGGQVGADLDAVDLLGQRHPGAHEVGQRHPLALVLGSGDRVVGGGPRLPEAQHHRHRQHRREHAVRRGQRHQQLAAPVPAEQQPDQHRHRADDQAAQQRVEGHVLDRRAQLGLRALGRRGDQRVALHQLVGAGGLGLAQLHLHAQRQVGGDAQVGQHRPGEQLDLPVQGRADHRLVAGQADLALAAEEQEAGREQRAAQPDREEPEHHRAAHGVPEQPAAQAPLGRRVGDLRGGGVRLGHGRSRRGSRWRRRRR